MTSDMKIDYRSLQTRQSGFALFLVLIMMIVIAFLVVATMQSTSMDTRTSANDSDHQLALQNAQIGLKAAEDRISKWPGLKTQQIFSCDCKDGLCAANGIDAAAVLSVLAAVEKNCGELPDVWKRTNVFSNIDGKDNKDPSTKVQPDNTTPSSPQIQDVKSRYVIEYLGPDKNAGVGIYLFRITAKGWGKNDSTTSIVEETIQASLYDF